MEKHTKSTTESSSQPQLTDKAWKLIDGIQDKMTNFQLAWKEGRSGDFNILVDQVLQLLRELKAEFNAASPASPIPIDSLGSFSDDIRRILQLCEEQDDATSTLAELTNLKVEPNVQIFQPGNVATAENNYAIVSQQEHVFDGFYQSNESELGTHNIAVNEPDSTDHLDYLQFDFHDDFDHGQFGGGSDIKQFGHDSVSNVLPLINPPPSAFLGPKCALWDCQRPAQGSEWCQDYCSSMHADLARSEGGPGMNPVLRPGGIGLKDDRLFATLIAKMQGKFVGIPECEGAAIEKSPWNASRLFDLSLLENETIREWLFFDKPRRAFESGNRKQRSLSDYNGRGWHESRKQVMKDHGGHKRSYYMDPQPPGCFEWHLYEYVLKNSDICALYKLELKLVSEKKSPKGKVNKDSLADLQKQMRKLTAEASADVKEPVNLGLKNDKVDESGSS